MVEENISDRLRALQSAMDFAAFGSAANVPRKREPGILKLMNGSSGLNRGFPVRMCGTEEPVGFATNFGWMNWTREVSAG